MKMRHRLALITMLTVAAINPSHHAAAVPLLAVDLGRIISGSPTAVHPEFSGMAGAVVESSSTQSFGVYAVTITGDGFYSAGFNAGHADPSVAALYEDYYYNNATANGLGIGLSIAGVAPNTDYDVTLWSYDMDNIFSPTATGWGPAGATTGTSGSVTNIAEPYPTTKSDYSTTIRVRSSSTTLEMFGTTTSGSGGTRLNGFALTAVPEPSSMALASLVALLYSSLRGRSKRQE